MTSADASSLHSARQPYSQAPKKFIIDLETRSKSFCLPVPVHRSNWTVETTKSSDDRPKSAIALRWNQMHLLQSSKLDLEKASTQAPNTTTDRNITKSKNQSARPSALREPSKMQESGKINFSEFFDHVKHPYLLHSLAPIMTQNRFPLRFDTQKA